MKVNDIIDICNGKLLSGNKELTVNKFSNDTRTIKDGEIYVAIKGANFDGNDYVDSAFEKGANAALVSKKVESKYKDKTIILVNDTIKAIGEIAKYKRSKFNGPVIGITGSVGKTTTKELVYSVISKKYNVLKTEGNHNNNIGVPMTIINSDSENAWVIEMGMNNSGEISYLSNIVKPTLSIITNVGTSHIGNLGSRENILKAKLEILDGMDNKVLIINNDNDMLHNYYLNNKENIITIGIDEESKYGAKINDKVVINDNILNISSEKEIVLDSLLAYAAGKYYEISDEDIVSALENYKTSDNRLNIIHQGDYKIINDSYNASYDSMKLAISFLTKQSGRKIAVLGDMFELGTYAKTIHRSVGLLISNDIDILLTVGSYSKYISDCAINNGYCGVVKHFELNSDAITYLNDNIKKGDVILVKASNGMHFNEIINAIKK